jgi:hypothetical protein
VAKADWFQSGVVASGSRQHDGLGVEGSCKELRKSVVVVVVVVVVV